ncbi:MAG: ribosome small subunit-dependent GTPase A [Balneolaceae bacterium]
MSKQGTVIQSTGKWYKVSVDGEIIECRLPGKFRLNQEEVTNPIAVGDHVDVEKQDDHTGSIVKIHERTNYIPRQATHGRRGDQILASNIDLAWSVVSVRKPRFKTGFIDRFLVTCEAYEVPAGILVNKTDLANKTDLKFLEDLEHLYSKLGYHFLKTSIYDPQSLEQLQEKIHRKISVFIGPSGVGKTSILNALEPDLKLSTSKISDFSGKGTHTTTFARLVPIQGDGFIVDTPGIRELGLVDIDPSELSLYYPEMLEPRKSCKFYDCTHSHEPDCGVVRAFENGEIHPERYNSYLNILESLEQ